MKIHRKKRTLTLLEIMIVIMLIGLIGSVIGVNMKGSLDQGRAFKTQQARDQIQDILTLQMAHGTSATEVVAKRAEYLTVSGLVKDPKKFLIDGWGQEFDVSVNHIGDIVVSSERLKAYERKKREKVGKKHDDDTTEEKIE
jgi:general secretion pathway protein G